MRQLRFWLSVPILLFAAASAIVGWLVAAIFTTLSTAAFFVADLVNGGPCRAAD